MQTPSLFALIRGGVIEAPNRLVTARWKVVRADCRPGAHGVVHHAKFGNKNRYQQAKDFHYDADDRRKLETQIRTSAVGTAIAGTMNRR